MKKPLSFLIVLSIVLASAFAMFFVIGCGTSGGGGGTTKVYHTNLGFIKTSGGIHSTSIDVYVGTFHDGAAVAGITVEAISSTEVVTREYTDAQGKCILSGLPAGKLLVTAWLESDELMFSVVTASGKVEFYAYAMIPDASEGTITGEVTDSASNELNGVRVATSSKVNIADKFAYSGGGEKTDSSGKYLLDDVVAGTVLIGCVSPELGGSYEVTTLSAGASKEVNLKILANQGTISGNITKPSSMIMSQVYAQTIHVTYGYGFGANVIVGSAVPGAASYSMKAPPTTADVKYWLNASATREGAGRSGDGYYVIDMGAFDVNPGAITTKSITIRDIPAAMSPSDASLINDMTPTFSWEAISWTPGNFFLYLHKEGSGSSGRGYYVAFDPGLNKVELPEPLELDGASEYIWSIHAATLPSGFDPAINVDVSSLTGLWESGSRSSTFETMP